MTDPLPGTINILGYSGSYLALLFETLTARGFKGRILIITNEECRRSPAPFETDIDYSVVDYRQLTDPPASGFILCNNNPETKRFLTQLYRDTWGLPASAFTSLLHPSCVIASTAQLEPGVYVEPLAVISAYTRVGFAVSVNRHCSIGHHSILHDFCSIHPGATVCSKVEIGQAASIGPGSTVFSDVKIGENSIIGGGSTVTKDIPANVLAFGNPCKPVKELTQGTDHPA